MPDGPDARSVRRFHARILGDPERLGVPRGLRWASPLAGAVLSRFRRDRLVRAYRRIWRAGESPLLTIAREQAAALEARLPGEMPVFFAMRYGRPGIDEALERVEALGIDAVVAVSMFPQQCRTTTLTIVRELYRQINRLDCDLDLAVRSIWYDDAGYVNAQARLVQEHACAHGLTPENTQLVYSLRSIPISSVDRGDPYMDQIHRTAELVSRHLGWPAHRTSMGYHGRPGSKRWLAPTLSEVLADLSKAGVMQVLVCPLGFATDCLETLEEVQIRSRAQFESDGGRFYACPALNTFEPFMAALRNLVLHGRHPVVARGPGASLLARSAIRQEPTKLAEAHIDSLVMVGMSLAGRLTSGEGPTLSHAEPDEFRAVKKTQCEVPDLLRDVCRDEAIREAWLWNTCRRFELYGWLNDDTDEADRAEVVAGIQRRLFNHSGRDERSSVNVLCGVDAWHHLMRTAAGLNSNLPGEREVLQQLRAAHRLAERAGTSGPLTDALLAEISENERQLREETEWGRFKPYYCYASIAQIMRSADLDLRGCRCVVLGGSTTSCGILDALSERFDVPKRQLTLLHRGHGHGGHLKMLRRAIGNGRRIRVHKYDEQAVLQAIAEADAVFIGLDRNESVLTAERIRACRDLTARPLTIVDFNMFGSTEGIENLDGVHLWTARELDAAVEAFAERMCRSEQFARAAEAAEAWIRDHLPSTTRKQRTSHAVALPV
jgi:ferrochelatase